jgi:hypothetical protein
VEVITLVRPDGYKRCRHGEAVQVARDGTVHIRQLMQRKVVGRREGEVPVLGGTYVTIK